jgi:hypothetical protein
LRSDAPKLNAITATEMDAVDYAFTSWRLQSPRVFLAGEELGFNILLVGHRTPANLSERLARTGNSGDRT